MSRKANNCSLSKSLKDGMSPVNIEMGQCLAGMGNLGRAQRLAFDNLTKDTGGRHVCLMLCLSKGDSPIGNHSGDVGGDMLCGNHYKVI